MLVDRQNCWAASAKDFALVTLSTFLVETALQAVLLTAVLLTVPPTPSTAPFPCEVAE